MHIDKNNNYYNMHKAQDKDGYKPIREFKDMRSMDNFNETLVQSSKTTSGQQQVPTTVTKQHPDGSKCLLGVDAESRCNERMVCAQYQLQEIEIMIIQDQKPIRGLRHMLRKIICRKWLGISHPIAYYRDIAGNGHDNSFTANRQEIIYILLIICKDYC